MSTLQSAGTILQLDNNVVAVVGCGGKTTFISSLARQYMHKKVLITPTTKILPPYKEDIICKTTLHECQSHLPAVGVQCLGILNRGNGKLEALPDELLAQLAPQYDVVLIEADGSRGLPCKGWLANEPVIPPYCTHTVGIVTLNALNKPASADVVLRLPQFLKLTGLQQGDTITLDALTAMVCNTGGMFQHSRGKQSLFVNQAEDEHTALLANKWLYHICTQYPNRFAHLAYGSAQTNQWKEV